LYRIVELIQELTLESVVEIRKQVALEKGDGFDFEPKERNTTVTKLTAGPGLIEADTKVFDIIGSNEQLAAGNGDVVCLFGRRRF
jgi:hypothetical protein